MTRRSEPAAAFVAAGLLAAAARLCATTAARLVAAAGRPCPAPAWPCAAAALVALAAGPAAATPAGDTRPAHAAAAGGLAPADLCRILERAVFPTPGAITEVLAGVFHDEVSGCDRPGCLLLVSGSWSELGGTPAPHDLVWDVLTSQGWTEVLDYSADGPDGTRLALRQGGNLCIVRGAWDGGDDADPAYVPRDAYLVTILCAREEPCLAPAPGGGARR